MKSAVRLNYCIRLVLLLITCFGVVLLSPGPSRAAFSNVDLTTTMGTKSIVDLWGSGPDDVYAGGASGRLVHWNGTAWAVRTLMGGNCIYALWGSGPNDVYAGGYGAYADRYGGHLVHWNGAKWEDVVLPVNPDGWGKVDFWDDIWGSGPDDVYVGGDVGHLVHWNGTNWAYVNLVGIMGSNTIHGIWGSGPSDVYAGGDDGYLVHWNGTLWVRVSLTSDTNMGSNDIQAIWGSGGSDVYAGGAGGHLVHWNGAGWADVNLATTNMGSNAIRGIWGSGLNDVYAGGDGGHLVHWNGAKWEDVVTTMGANRIWGIWGSGASDVYAGGDGGYLINGYFTAAAPPAATFTVTTENSGTETAGTAFSVTLTAKDGDGNTATGYTGAHSVAWTWTATNSPGSNAPNKPGDGNQTFTAGVVTVAGFTLTNSGETPTITGTAGSVNGTSAAITVNDGALNYVKVRDAAGGGGAEVTTHSMTADQTYVVYAAGYDQYGNYISDQSVSWTATGVCSGKLSPATGTSTTFTAVTSGIGTIVVTDYGSITGDATGIITVGAILPTVTTIAASSIAATTAQSGGNVTSDGGSAITARGVCWSTSVNPSTADSHTTDGTGTGTFTSSITGLLANTTYYVRAYATSAFGTAYGDDVSFTTSNDGTGVLPGTQNAGPNGGDGNGDGILDSKQTTIASLPAATGGGYITVSSTSPCNQIEQVTAYTYESVGINDPGHSYPFGLVGFRFSCSPVTVKIYYHGVESLDGYIYRKYGATPADWNTSIWYTMTGVTFGTEEIGEETVPYAQFVLTVSELGDDTNGLPIIDQGGPELFDRTSIPTLSEWGMILFALLLAGTAVVFMRRRNMTA